MKLTKLSLATISLTAAINAIAALPANSDPIAVNLASSSGQFIVGVTGYYLKPSPTGSDTAYASVAAAFSNTTAISGLFSPETNYDWGYGINLGYIFPNSPFDVNLTYFHLGNNQANDTILAPDGINPAKDVGPVSVILGNVGRYDTAAASVKYAINQVDLTVGKYVNYGCRVQVHPNIGLRYTALDRELNSFYIMNPASTRNFFGTTAFDEDSDFEGFGPIIGVDGSFYIARGFGAVAHADYALLFGNIDATVNEADVLNQVVPPASTPFSKYFKDEDDDRVIQVADLKLGGNYTYLFNQNSNSNLTLEIGYQFTGYLRPIDRLETEGRPAARDSDFLGLNSSDLGLHGPYASLVVHV